MGWLLELLLDGIREICSQFIVDMMELVTEMFTELLSCNLSLFEELFSVVSALYKNVIVPMGIAILLLILVWQLFKSMFGKSVNSEEPVELLIRSAIALFFVVASKPIVNYILRFAGTPYQWVMGTEIEVKSFSGFVSALEGVTDTLGIGKLSISILMLIMQFVVAWNYFKMLFIIAERYVLLGVFSYTAPLAFSTGGSKSTNNILASWSKMFGGQVVLIILNAWCMKMFLSGYGNIMASSYGFTKFFVATLCLVGFCKITFKLDSYMASLGVNLGRSSPGMGAMGLIMAASRALSHVGRGSAGFRGGSSPTTGDASGVSSGGSMTEGFTGPIPMTAGEAFSGSMGTPEGSAKSGFQESADISGTAQEHGDFSYPAEEPSGGGSVLEELGVVTAVDSSAGRTDTEIRTDYGTGIGRGETGAAFGNTDGAANGDGIHTGGFEEEAPMDMNFSGIPEYGEETALSGETVDFGGTTSQEGTASADVFAMPGEADIPGGIALTDGLVSADSFAMSEGTVVPEGISSSDGLVSADSFVMSDRTGSADGIVPAGGTDMVYGSGMQDGMAAGEKLAGRERQTMEVGNGLTERGTSGGIPVMGPGFGNDNAGIISEIGDYPVDREIPESTDECDMELDGNMLEGMGRGLEADGVSCGSAGDAYGNSSLASRNGRLSGKGNGLRPAVTAGAMPGAASLTEPDGILAEVGTDFGTGTIEASGIEKQGPEMPSAMELSEETGDVWNEPGKELETGGIEPYSGTAAGMNSELSGTSMESGSGGYHPADAGMQSGQAGNLSAAEDVLSGNGKAETYMADEPLQDFETQQEERNQDTDPMNEMAGQMSHLEHGSPIPSGNQRRHGRKNPSRQFLEVPRTREELRRRQKEMKNHNPIDGLD